MVMHMYMPSKGGGHCLPKEADSEQLVKLMRLSLPLWPRRDCGFSLHSTATIDMFTHIHIERHGVIRCNAPEQDKRCVPTQLPSARV